MVRVAGSRRHPRLRLALLLPARASLPRAALVSAIPALVSALSLAATVATTAMWMAYTVFWAIPSTYLKGPAAAGGIALINTIGVLGGFSSPAANTINAC